MIPAAFAPLAAHLWQSTLFAAAAGLLTLALRRNQARVRYWIWLAASYKFLLPFSWLVSIGHLFQWRSAPAIISPSVSSMTEAVSQPLFLTPLPAATLAPSHMSAIVAAIWAVWACGFVAVAAGWAREWLRVRAIVRAASPLSLGLPIRVVSTASRLEPGVVGVFRPVLLLPDGIAACLSQQQLQAVLAHELCHIRRRDNLAAAVHMLVEALFWFHPLVWWLGARMIDERERACDEEVLQSGSGAHVYAESILKVCEFYLESPLGCVSGITGSDLKKRIARIMKQHFGVALSARKKLLLATVGVAALAVPVVVGALTPSRLRAQSSATTRERPSFDAASIKPNKSGDPRTLLVPQPGGRWTGTNTTVSTLITAAYQLMPHQLTGGPGWIGSERFDIEAKAEGNPPREQMLLMIQSLLADRFKLAVHHETRQLPVYALVLSKAGKTGPQLTPHSDDAKCIQPPTNAPMPLPNSGEAMPVVCGRLFINGGRFAGNNVTMDRLVAVLSNVADRPIVDRTGLNGTYDLTIEFSQPGTDASGADPSAPPLIFTALQDQLGLKLESQTGPVDVLVIDHVEEPSPN